jgi:DNA polymerase-3 subunit beta
MKLSCKREKLSLGLSIVGRMVKQRATLPVLSNVLLSSDKGQLKMVATDLEATISHWIGAKIDEEGAITVPARTLAEYIATSTDETVTLVSEGADVSVKGSRHFATIKGLPAEEFPIIPQVKGGKPIKVKAEKLKNAINCVVMAAAQDETRPVLTGVLLKVKGEKLLLVATDSYRLAEKTISLDGSAEMSSDFSQKGEVIIPQRTLADVARVLSSLTAGESQDETDVEIVAGENQVQFKFGEIEFISRQIEGAFPDYEQIIPKDFVMKCEIDKNEFVEAIKMANIFAREAGNNVKISVSESDFLVSAISAQVGNSETHIKAVSKGSSLSVAFNARYLLDALTVMNAERVNFDLSGSLSPGLIYSKDEEGFRYVVMPLRSE